MQAPTRVHIRVRTGVQLRPMYPEVKLHNAVCDCSYADKGPILLYGGCEFRTMNVEDGVRHVPNEGSDVVSVDLAQAHLYLADLLKRWRDFIEAWKGS
ncbi:hypothetical protein CRG98_028516 [Punica granatum]|uniref:Uncharacterized protein n=1 Tax=Punica granatum TaxID=22663 RepID=A0A2I0J4C3_PUNGR|nr:hypothetical protein CRG98_028516 [Punica granatum]